MNLPNVGWAATEHYGVATIPMIMVKLPGKLKMIRAPNVNGGQSIVDFAREQFAKLTDEEAADAAEAAKLPMPEIDPGRTYCITYPDTGLSVDLRTGQPWVDAVPIDADANEADPADAEATDELRPPQNQGSFGGSESPDSPQKKKKKKKKSTKRGSSKSNSGIQDQL
jgi:hypothetical protein